MSNQLKFTGKIKGIGPIVEGEKNGKKWAKREFVVEEQGPEYPQSFKFSMFKNGEYTKYVTGFENEYSVGDTVTVEMRGKCSNHNGKTYNNVDCWRIDKAEGTNAPEQHDEGPLFPTD